MDKVWDTILTYIEVAPLPHSNALFFGISGVIALKTGIKRFWQRKHLRGIVYSCGGVVSVGISIFAEADARSRFRQYQRIRALLTKRGWKQRIVEPLLYSRCQRDAAKVAAARTGYNAEITAYFREKGYRWYHVVPDALVKDPAYIFNRHFLESSFFVKEHRPKQRSSPVARVQSNARTSRS